MQDDTRLAVPALVMPIDGLSELVRMAVRGPLPTIRRAFGDHARPTPGDDAGEDERCGECRRSHVKAWRCRVQ